MTDEQRAEYLRHLEHEARDSYRARQVDPITWAIDRHMTTLELALVRAWRRIRGCRE